MAQAITDKLVKDLAKPASGNSITYDEEVPGFGIRVTKAGAKSFVLNYRVAGRERRLTIGRYPAWSVEAARKEAKRRRQEVDKGHDPLAKRTAERRAPTVGDLCDRYISDYLPKKREASAKDDKAMIAQIIRLRLGAEKVERIRHSNIDDLHRSLKATPYRANRVVALLSKMFSLAVKWEMRADNPAKGVERNQEVKRERYLSPAEIVALTDALATTKSQTAANVVRLLLLTGARRSEVLKAEWAQFDLEAGVWTKPAATTKQKKLHRVPLSDGATALLKSILDAAPRDDDDKLKSPFLFPGTRSGQPLSEIRDEWEAIALAAGLFDVVPGKNAKGEPIEVKRVNCRLHDLRHTYASILASAGLSLPIIGQLLGHSQPATTARYSHLLDDPLRAATNRVGDIVGGKKSADVVPLRQENA
jgi:integrase